MVSGQQRKARDKTGGFDTIYNVLAPQAPNKNKVVYGAPSLGAKGGCLEGEGGRGGHGEEGKW